MSRRGYLQFIRRVCTQEGVRTVEVRPIEKEGLQVRLRNLSGNRGVKKVGQVVT